ncbi:MAG: hypothetical protein AAF633_05560 [Chloroflexota bacterium]
MDRALACQTCHYHMTLDDGGLSLIDVKYGQSATRLNRLKSWEPVWVFYGKVTMSSRKARKKDSRAALTSETLWGKKRHLFIPAGEIDFHTLREEGMRLLDNQPPLRELEEMNHAKLGMMSPAILSAADAEEMLDFLVLGLEAKRPDILRSIDFSIEIDSFSLWALPYDGNRFLI